MCGGSACLTAYIAKHWELPQFTVIGVSVVVGGTVYMLLLRALLVDREFTLAKNK